MSPTCSGAHRAGRYPGIQLDAELAAAMRRELPFEQECLYDRYAQEAVTPSWLPPAAPLGASGPKLPPVPCAAKVRRQL